VRRLLLFTGLLLFGPSLFADFVITSSEPWEALSADGRWRLVVTPVQIDRDYAGAALFRKGRFGWRRTARWHLVNKHTTDAALVANDGTTVTFNRRGPGGDIVVIYRPDGTLVRSFAFTDLLIEDDISLFDRTVSFIHWSGTHRLDEETRRVIVQVTVPRQPAAELPISLDTGALLVPKKRRFVGPPQIEPTVSYRADAEDAAGRPCAGGISLSSADLLSRATAPVTPAYPPVAVKARVQGDVLVEVAVTEEGAVDSVKVVKPLPFGLDQAALDAAHKWRFAPLRRDGVPATLCGRFFMSYALDRIDPPMPE
jgi:TonB family protein